MASDTQRVLVTGGAGFIGSELVRQLAAAGNEVLIVDNLINGRLENIEDILNDRVRFSETDIRDEQRLATLLAGVNVVYHLACLGVRHSIHSPHENHEVNATASLTLLSLARAADVQRFVYVSSSEVYGTARTVPMTEQHPTYPMTVYGSSKLSGECYTRAFHRTYRYPTVVVRPFNAYGPRCHHEGDSGEVIPKFMLRCMAGKPMIAFGDGTQTRDFTYVSDTARGIFLAGTNDDAIGKTINIGSGEETSINDLAAEIARVLDKPGAELVHDTPRPGDVLRLYADSTQAHELLGFQPQITLHDGLAKLRDWYTGSGRDAETLLAQEVTHNWLVTESENHG